jgi:hypothetical protein
MINANRSARLSGVFLLATLAGLVATPACCRASASAPTWRSPAASRASCDSDRIDSPSGFPWPTTHSN